uniref:Myotubularin phosphatase domain-containing protein n=1 Tax=Strongyloides papillosus TaxID=174720 RepID=A0A0N5BTJ5_STREA
MASSMIRGGYNATCDWLYEGESILFEEKDVGTLIPNQKIYGLVRVTNYRIHFEYNNKFLFEIPLGYIWSVEEITNPLNEQNMTNETPHISILCKDVRIVKFYFENKLRSGKKNFLSVISKSLHLSIIELSHFAFNYRDKFNNNGWNLYDPLKEYERLGIPNQLWMLSDFNRNYSICESYPGVLCIPREAANKGIEYIKNISEGRINGRLPVLSWYDKNKKSAILRSSQPCTFDRNEKGIDEKYLEFVISANENSCKLPILDLRTFLSAEASQIQGGGYEAAYNNCPVEFLNLTNIHSIRESFRKLTNACFPTCDQKNWLKILAETKWLLNIQLILNAATRVIVEVNDKQNSVLIHCDDGVDRTTQVVSLAMLMLDPYYRTIKGFLTLIEKEWTSFGHPFNTRNGNGKNRDYDYSPLFLQWIDCIWQVFTFLPGSFEFNEQFLISIIDQSLSNKFGNFITNSEKERNIHSIKKNTNSLWSYLLDNIAKYQNPLYNPKIEVSHAGTCAILLSSIKNMAHAPT